MGLGKAALAKARLGKVALAAKVTAWRTAVATAMVVAMGGMGMARAVIETGGVAKTRRFTKTGRFTKPALAAIAVAITTSAETTTATAVTATTRTATLAGLVVTHTLQHFGTRCLGSRLDVRGIILRTYASGRLCSHVTPFDEGQVFDGQPIIPALGIIQHIGLNVKRAKLVPTISEQFLAV